MVEFKNLIYEKKDGMAKITVNRPPLNVYDTETLREITTALQDSEADSNVHIIVVTGSGEKAFSAGVEIKDHFPDKIHETLDSFHTVFSVLTEITKPTVAVVRGLAFGGGCELASACDIVLASEDAKFGQQEVKVGAIPTIATVLLPRIINRRKALEIIFTGDTLTAEEAKELGLVNRIFSLSEFDNAVEDFIDKFRQKSPIVLRLLKKAVYHGIDKDFTEALKGVTNIYLHELIKTEDAVEGLKAFLEKRKPTWRGR